MGAGPDALLAGGVADARVERVGQVDESRPEIARTVQVDRRLAERVAEGVGRGAFPLVVAGECNSCLGTVAGVGAEGLGVLWLDAHADFDTPDDNLSGFFDVMALSALAGRCWPALTATIPGFRPVDEARVTLVGARDLEPYQRASLAASAVRTPAADRVEGALAGLGVERLYLHVDLDVLDPSEGVANEYAAPGGLSVEDVVGIVGLAFARFDVAAAAVTAYDPGADRDGRMAASAARVLAAIAAGVRGG